MAVTEGMQKKWPAFRRSPSFTSLNPIHGKRNLWPAFTGGRQLRFHCTWKSYFRKKCRFHHFVLVGTNRCAAFRFPPLENASPSLSRTHVQHLLLAVNLWTKSNKMVSCWVARSKQTWLILLPPIKAFVRIFLQDFYEPHAVLQAHNDHAICNFCCVYHKLNS